MPAKLLSYFSVRSSRRKCFVNWSYGHSEVSRSSFVTLWLLELRMPKKVLVASF